jgi:alpha-glucosidase
VGAHGDEARARLALVLILTLRGTPVLYAGDEIALRDGEVPPERERDPVAHLGDPAKPGRDGCRTPMPWTDAPGAGFTEAWVEPWLPFGSLGRNVADQRADPDSTLHLVRDLIALRRAEPQMARGAYAELPAPRDAWAFARGEGFAVALNVSGTSVAVDGLTGEVLVCTDRERDGERVDGVLALEPWQALVLRRG